MCFALVKLTLILSDTQREHSMGKISLLYAIHVITINRGH
jgi:hypothetical protein